MQNLRFLALAFILCSLLAEPASAQDRASPEEQMKALIDFSIAASFHDEVIRSIQIQCSKYKAQVLFNDNLVNSAKKLSPEIGQLLDRIIQGAKPLAKAHAAQIVANADGCETDNFKKSIEAVESHQAMLAMRGMQGRFK